MNNENLRSLADRPAEERRSIASMGGIASGEARRERKALREAFEIALNCPVTVDGTEMQAVDAVALATVEAAMNGDMRAVTILRDTCDGKPAERIIAEPTISEETRREVEALLFGTDETE